MIVGFRHKGLRLLYENNDPRRLPPQHVARIGRILARLDVAADPTAMKLPGLHLHPLRGTLAGYWSVRVSANWRIVFRFDGGDAAGVDLTDYH
ncbi:MAG: type II toxin-antitoxin system RelE/ParE family toxin [Acidobacteria bacterium]|nr:type II toxin-antitoxin system RelE/ParE family toxin [Acidobacteriota bacterium]